MIEAPEFDEMKSPFAAVARAFSHPHPRVGAERVREKIREYLPEESLVPPGQGKELLSCGLEENKSVPSHDSPTLRRTRVPGTRFSSLHRRSISRKNSSPYADSSSKLSRNSSKVSFSPLTASR